MSEGQRAQQPMDLELERSVRAEAELRHLRDHDETWAELFDEYVLRGMYEREVLDHRTRELNAVAALVALGHQAALAIHLKGALRHGATPAEVLEAIVQTSVYAGFATTLAGLRTWDAVRVEIGIASKDATAEGVEGK